jgi:hypothetical protein
MRDQTPQSCADDVLDSGHDLEKRYSLDQRHGFDFGGSGYGFLVAGRIPVRRLGQSSQKRMMNYQSKAHGASASSFCGDAV